MFRTAILLVTVLLAAAPAHAGFGPPLGSTVLHGGSGADGIFIADPAAPNYNDPNNVFRNLQLGSDPAIVFANGDYVLDTDKKACFDVTIAIINVDFVLRGSTEFLLRSTGQIRIEFAGRLRATGDDGKDGGAAGCGGGKGGSLFTQAEGKGPGATGTGVSGGGGGGHVIAGGSGLDGDCLPDASGGPAVATTSPLAGSGGGSSADGKRGGGGGGIIYLLADDTVTIHGFVSAFGGEGEKAGTGNSGGGGGSGGTLTIAAPAVTFLGESTGLGAFGGDGGFGPTTGCKDAGNGGDGANGEIFVFTNGWFPQSATIVPAATVKMLSGVLPEKEPVARIALQTNPFHPEVANSAAFLFLSLGLGQNPLPLPGGTFLLDLNDPLFVESLNGFQALGPAGIVGGAQGQSLGFPNYSGEWTVDFSSVTGLIPTNLTIYTTGVAINAAGAITGVTDLGEIRYFPE